DDSPGTNITPGGVIKTVDGKRVEQLLIRSNTPGIAMQSAGGPAPQMSFVPGQESNFMPFTSKEQKTPHHQDPDQHATLYFLKLHSAEDQGKVLYDGKVFDVVKGADVHLMVEKGVFSRFSQKRKKLPGRTLAQNNFRPGSAAQ